MIRKVAFFGTGLMGAPMAANLINAGFDLSVWNRTRAKAEALGARGAQVAHTPADAVSGAQVVISMLSDGAAVDSLLEDPALSAELGGGDIWIDMSSIRPAQARKHAAQLTAFDVAHLDAPVSGGVRGAEDATLAIMAGGDAAVFEIVRPVLEAMGRPVHVGPSGAGQLAKLSNQAIVAITIGAVAEATLFLKSNGADPAAARDAMAGGFADSKILQMHGRRMSDGDFVPGGTSRMQLKDLVNVLAESDAGGLDLPLTRQVHDRYTRLCDQLGGADLDHAALYRELCDRNTSVGDIK